MDTVISEVEIILRRVLAAGLDLMIGYERERQNQAAGLHTYDPGDRIGADDSIENLATQFRGIASIEDRACLAAQAILGIGFSGTDASLRFGTDVKGLTAAEPYLI